MRTLPHLLLLGLAVAGCEDFRRLEANYCSAAGKGSPSCTGTLPDGGSAGDAGGVPDGGALDPLAFEATCVDYYTRYCQKLADCGTVATGRVADCAANLDRGGCKQLGESVRRGLRTFDVDAGARCLTLVTTAKCDVPLNGCPASALSPGTAAVGARCSNAADCAGQTACVGGGCSKICEAAGGENQRCAKGTCGSGLFCDASTGRCLAPRGPGNPCSSNDAARPHCAPSAAYCDVGAGMCKPLPGPNAPCLASQFSQRCATGAWCQESAAPTCRADTAPGSPCTDGSECGSQHYCGGTCLPRRAAGQSCPSIVNACLSPSVCSLGTCGPPKAENQPCSGLDCAGGMVCDPALRTCQRTRSGGLGSVCTEHTLLCTRDLRCVGSVVTTDGGVGKTGTCQMPVLNEPCSKHFECAQGWYCNLSAAKPGCQPASGANPCSGDTNCEGSRFCPTNLPVSGQLCTPKRELDAGCSPSLYYECQAPLHCQLPSAGATMGTCRNWSDEGDMCLSSGQCRHPLACVGGRCAGAGRPGEPCRDGTCMQGICNRTTDRCEALREPAQPCSGSSDCALGRCELFVCQSACSAP